MRKLISVLFFLAIVTGCGQKGPLFLAPSSMTEDNSEQIKGSVRTDELETKELLEQEDTHTPTNDIDL